MTNAERTFSVIVPAFNASATVERCLRSVLDQTFEGFELIVVDDASGDETAEVIGRLADPRLKLLRNAQNMGPGETRNRAVEAARGTFVVFVDADDWIEPTFLSAAHAAMTGSGAPDLLITGYRVITPSGETFGRQRFAGGNPLTAFLEDQMVTALWAKVFRRAIIEEHEIRCPSIRLMEDSAFLASYMTHVRSVGRIDAPLYVYDTRSASITGALSVPAMLDATDIGLKVTAEGLGSRRAVYRRALRTREFRMLAMQAIRELARARITDRAVINDVRRRLWNRLGLRVLAEANLRWSERVAYLLFLVVPKLTVRAVSRRSAR